MVTLCGAKWPSGLAPPAVRGPGDRGAPRQGIGSAVVRALEAYDDLSESRYVIGRVTDADELVRTARRWLESVLAGQRHGSDTG